MRFYKLFYKVVFIFNNVTINLQNLLVSRDNMRQGIADLFTLAATIPTMDIDNDGNR